MINERLPGLASYTERERGKKITDLLIPPNKSKMIRNEQPAISTYVSPAPHHEFTPHSCPSFSSSQSSYTNLAFLGRTFFIRDVDLEFGLQGEEWAAGFPPLCQPPEMAEPVALPELEPGLRIGLEPEPGLEPGELGFEMGAAEGAG